MMAGLTPNKATSTIKHTEEYIFASDSDTDLHENVKNGVKNISYDKIDLEEPHYPLTYRHSSYNVERSLSSAANISTSSTPLGSAARIKRSPSIITPCAEANGGIIFSTKGAVVGEHLLRIARGGATPLQRIAARRQLVALGGPYAVLGHGSPFSVWTRPSPLNPNVIAQHMKDPKLGDKLKELDENCTILRKGIGMPQEVEEGAFDASQHTLSSACNSPSGANIFSMESSYFEKSPDPRCVYSLTRAECCAVSLLAMEYSEEDEEVHTVDLTVPSPSCSQQGSYSNLSVSAEACYAIGDKHTGRKPLRDADNEFQSPYSTYHDFSTSHEKSVKNCSQKRSRKGFSGTKMSHLSNELSHKPRVARRLDYSIHSDKEESTEPLKYNYLSSSLTATVIERQNYRNLQSKWDILSINY
ncbi:unnamed protein product [Phytomonas sp. Hart1]|nr:unnamed protein product [Phytomonas sp. Hart1]|eukprot:CCW71164.1 unnamed protein product [Phytomonas sp. isolate Hart1]